MGILSEQRFGVETSPGFMEGRGEFPDRHWPRSFLTHISPGSHAGKRRSCWSLEKLSTTALIAHRLRIGRLHANHHGSPHLLASRSGIGKGDRQGWAVIDRGKRQAGGAVAEAP